MSIPHDYWIFWHFSAIIIFSKSAPKMVLERTEERTGENKKAKGNVKHQKKSENIKTT